MAAADNPFYIAPPNVLQALMTGEQSYQAAKKEQEQQLIQSIGKDILSGKLGPDSYAQIAAKAFQGNNPQLGMMLLKTAEESKAAAEHAARWSPTAGGQPASPLATLMTPPPQSAPQANQPPMMPSYNGEPPRPVVPSTDKVIGDEEAQRRGLYETPPSAQPASQAQPSNQPAPQGTAVRAPLIPDLAQRPDVRAAMSAMGDLRLPQSVRDANKAYLENVYKQNLPPDDIKKYSAAVSQGFRGTLQDWLAQTSHPIEMTPGGQQAQVFKSRLEADKKTLEASNDETLKARKAIPLMDEVLRISPTIGGGWAAYFKPLAAKVRSTVGLDVPDGMSNAEVLNSIVRLSIPSIREPGSTANYEQQLYMEAMPSLLHSEEGRAKIASLYKATAKRTIELNAAMRKYHGAEDLPDRLAAIDSKPMFSAEDRAALEAIIKKNKPAAQNVPPPFTPQNQGGGPARITSPAERDALPPGSQYIAPDGSLRTKQ